MRYVQYLHILLVRVGEKDCVAEAPPARRSQHRDQYQKSQQKTKEERALRMPRVAPRRGHGVAVDGLGRRRRSRCKLRYCDSTCQHDHWRRGHKQMCKKIHRGGNAEQYNADKKYKEAVAVAVEACADDSGL